MDERRKFKRFSIGFLSNFFSGDKNKTEDCKVTEISPEGARLQTQKVLKVGQNLNLKIDVPLVKDSVNSIITVKWSKKVYDETGFEFQVGGELKIEDPEEKRTFLKWLRILN